MVLPADLPHVSLSVEVFRVVRAGYDPLSVAGSFGAGGRYNIAGTFGALYTSLEKKAAAAEVFRINQRRGVDLRQAPAGSWWVYTMDVSVSRVLDLTDPDTRARAGISESQLVGEGTDATRRIASEARDSGYQALLVPSVAEAGSKNLVLFLDTLEGPPRLTSSRPVDFAAL